MADTERAGVVRRLVDRGPLLCLVGCILAQAVPWIGMGLPPTPVSDVLSYTAFGWGVLRAIRLRRFESLGVWPFVFGCAGVALALVAAMGSPQPTMAGQGLIRIVQVFLVMPGAFLLNIRTRKDLRLVLTSLLGLCVFQAVVNVWQNQTGHGALIAGQPIRGIGTFGPAQIQVGASTVAAGVALCTAVVIAHRGRQRLLGIGLLVVLWAGLVAGLARATWISAAGVTILLLTRFAAKRAVLVFGGAAVALWGLVLAAQASHSALGDRLLSVFGGDDGPDQSGTDRLSLWAAARGILNDYPFFGLGPRQFQAHRDAYAPFALLGSSDIGSAGSFAREALLSPHNLYYLLSTEFGIPGAACFIGMVVAGLTLGVDRLRRTPMDNHLAWYVGLASSGMALNFFIDGMFGDLGGSGTLLVAWAVSLSVWWAAQGRRTIAGPAAWATGEVPPEPGKPWWRWGDESTTLSARTAVLVQDIKNAVATRRPRERGTA